MIDIEIRLFTSISIAISTNDQGSRNGAGRIGHVDFGHAKCTW